jgi:hypothetical protein
MNWKNRTDSAMPDSENDPVLERALTDFRASVHAWSEAAYSRPRTPVRAAHGSSRRVAAWAMGCVLAAGGVSGALYERHHREAMARLAEQAREAQQRQQAAQRQPAADEDLLATVDSDIARDVPAAMEPLENLMDEGNGQ